MAQEKENKKTGYQPAEWEDALYQRWLQSGFFNPDVCLEKGVADAKKPPFSMVLPPPNATGTLHTGHAIMLALEDSMARFARMQGRATLWLPGTDHAAIATQSKVERLIWEKENQTRYDLGREKLLHHIGEFVEENRSTIKNQVQKMGSSLDWSREAFTLDSKRHQAVIRAFKKMYDDGIIYRGDRIVNWDPKGQTTISDDEIVYKEETTRFYYFQYGPFVIGTARPETKFGDKYVVMHPNDERYQEYQHGQQIELEWINGPITATIIKDEAIDPAFGTGVMTITPWHSAIDFDIAERHNLEKEQVIDLEGKLLPIAGEFSGKHITDARKSIVKKLESKNLLVKVEENYVHQVATAERTGEVIEPQIMRQWFVGVNKEFTQNGKTATLKTLMQEALTSRGGNITILPSRFEKIYFHWIDNLRDWCISRQIWYGHRIPVWYRNEEIYCGEEAPTGEGWEQDSDTLDTWFSSALWTFSTLGWGYNEAEWQKNKKYHPTEVLETGYDILFPWVARMILMSTYLLGEPPFKTVYLHGLVRDEQGRKMSKSLDNILDPLDVIKEYGTDALRLALMSGTTPGNDLRLGSDKLIAMRNLVNKIWNISRYIKLQEKSEGALQLNTPADHFIVGRFEKTRTLVTEYLESYNFSLAIDALREFTITDLADWYIEVHKQEKNTPLLYALFKELITLWHPLIPFVTEAICQDMYSDQELLMVRSWPRAGIFPASDPTQEEIFTDGQRLVTDIRAIKSMYNIAPSTLLGMSFTQPEQALVFATLLNLVKVDQAKALSGISVTVGKGQALALLSIGDAIDVEKERQRLQKEIEEAKNYANAMRAKLTNEGFLANAGPMLKASTENLVRVTEERITALNKALSQLE